MAVISRNTSAKYLAGHALITGNILFKFKLRKARRARQRIDRFINLKIDTPASDVVMKPGDFIVQGIGIVAVVYNILRSQLNRRSDAIDCKGFSGISACNAVFGVKVCLSDNVGCIAGVFIRSTC